jgi:hypothetical protein
MKRRVAKKLINRYITPLIKDLPRTKMRGWEYENEFGEICYVEGRNHSIRNGEVFIEGTKPTLHLKPLQGIKKTRDIVREIIATNDTVYLRWAPEWRGGRVFMRLITGKVIT